MLDDDLGGVNAGAFPLHAALEIVVAQLDGEVQLVVDVLNAGDGASFGVNLAVELGSGADVGHHVAGVTVDGHVVTPAQGVGGGLFDGQVGFFDLGQGVGGVVAQSADVVAGVVEVVGMTSERRVVAQILAIFSGRDGLIHRVHGLEDLAHRPVVNAQSLGFVEVAVDLEIIDAFVCGAEDGEAGEGVSVLVIQSAVAVVSVKCGRSAISKQNSFDIR